AWFHVAGEARMWERAAQAGRGPPQSQAPARDPEMFQRLERASDVIRRISLPWDGLFRGMERAASDRIALLAVEPDPVPPQVVVSGEARAYAEVLRYMSRLEAEAVLTQPGLLHHEVRAEGQQRPVAFSITAHWSMIP